MNCSDLNIGIGEFPKGAGNLITDVPGVRVGHVTIDNERSKTGVTVVLPCDGNVFRDKLIAASFVLNGFGKTQGLVQVDELGTLETPIALTNTLNVGLVHDAMVEYMLGVCAKDGIELTSVNPVVCECNDASLNDISLRAVHKEHVFDAIKNADTLFAQGDVGCGKGMTCHGLKGGVGSASRLIEIEGRTFTLGVLAQTNHGSLRDLRIDGKPVGRDIYNRLYEDKPDEGSCIVIVATDLPLTSRQLRRVIKRAAVGLARNGSYFGHGSGDVFIGFTTANRIYTGKSAFHSMEVLDEGCINSAFRACAEATEEAVLNSMLAANPVTGYSGKHRYSLSEFVELTGKDF